jgi:hypothetical protein
MTRTIGLALLMGVLWMQGAAAQDALQILKSMSDFVGGEKNISIAFDSDIEVMTSDLQKIQFTNSGTLQLSRPDKLHATRTGGYADVELFYDGKTFTVRDKANNVAAKASAPATIDKLIDELRDKYGVEAPGADLLSADVSGTLIKDVVDAKYVGRGVVEGVECEHLAFRNADVDWQLWVDVGSKPIPRKYVITSKAVTGAPQYTLVIKQWSDAAASPDAYSFKEAGTKLVDFQALGPIDEVPAGVVPEVKK